MWPSKLPSLSHLMGRSKVANIGARLLAPALGSLAIYYVAELTHLGRITINPACIRNGQFRAISLSEDIAIFVMSKQIDHCCAILTLSSVCVHVTTFEVEFLKANKLTAHTNKVNRNPAEGV